MAKNTPYEALQYQEFNIYLLVRFSMVLAWSMQFIVIEWLVYDLTKDPLSLGLIGLAEVIPAVSLSLFAGHVVDQKEKKSLLVSCLFVFCLISLGLFYITSKQVRTTYSVNYIVYAIYFLVFIGGIVRSFIGPTVFSLMALIVPKKTYANAATWSSSVWQTAVVLGPALAGFLIHWIGEHHTLFFVFAFSLIAFMGIFKIKKKPILNPKIGEPIFKSLSEGVKFVFNTKIILTAITLDMIAVLFGGAVALLPIFALDILKVGSLGFGFLRAAPAIGAVISMFASAYFPIKKNAGTKLLIAIFGFGICIIIFGLSTWYWLSLVALFFSGITDGVSMVIRQTILQLKTPDEMRGRVASVNSMFVGSSNELGAFESGITAKLMGTVTAVVFGGCMTVLTTIITGFSFPNFRKLHLDSKDEDVL